jgi:hypothetical protein
VVHGNQYNFTVIQQDGPAPRTTLPGLIQTTTTLQTTNRDAIAAFLRVPLAENATTILITQV